MLVELLEVKEKKENYKSVANQEVGNIFRVISVAVDFRGYFHKLNSSDCIKTSVITRIEIESSTKTYLKIETENTNYLFEVI